jgi:hypothetical protein
MLNIPSWQILVYMLLAYCRYKCHLPNPNNECQKYWSVRYTDVCHVPRVKKKYCEPRDISSNVYDFREKRCRFNYTTFLEITLRTFGEEFANTNDYNLVKKILKIIWHYIGGSDTNKLALFVASSLHNTSYYKIFREYRNPDTYKSRGLLMIKGRENYKWLSHHSLQKNNYLQNPELLADPDYSAIGDTIVFWEHKLRGCYTFENMMESFRILSWLENRRNPDIVNWNNSYLRLRNAYNRYK